MTINELSNNYDIKSEYITEYLNSISNDVNVKAINDYFSLLYGTICPKNDEDSLEIINNLNNELNKYNYKND